MFWRWDLVGEGVVMGGVEFVWLFWYFGFLVGNLWVEFELG